MTQYGDNTEPSIISDITSTADQPVSAGVASTVGFVGQADLDAATNAADTGTVYQVTKKRKAREWFGPEESSLLTNAIMDAFDEGAVPVYAVAAPETEVTAEDHASASSTSVDLDNGPIREGADSITVSLDGTDLTVNVVRDDPASYSPEAGECYVNPVYAQLEVPSTPSTSLDVDYAHFDYTSAVDVITNEVPDVIDYLQPITERQAVTDYCNVAVGNLEDQYELVMLHAGADIYIDLTNVSSNFTQSYDDSRTQTVYPTRFEDGTSALAAYTGFVASQGLTETPINKRLSTNKSLLYSPDRAQRGALEDSGVVPLADEPRGVRITDDPTTVSPDNTDEFNIKFGFNRKVADHILATTKANERPFIGRLNSDTVRNTLESLIDDSLGQLQASDAVISYDVTVNKVSATEAELEMYVDLVEPLRFIRNTISIGNES
jgi:hypothetical protein